MAGSSFAGLTPAALAVAAAEARAAWNLHWRFSPGKAGLWQEAFRIGAALAAGWGLGRRGPLPAETIVYAMLFQVIAFGLVGGVQEAHRRLFATRWLPLFHQSAAAGDELLAALALGGLPGITVSNLLAAIVLTGGWAWPGRLGMSVIAAALGLVAGVAAQAVARAAVIVLARLRPGLLGQLGAVALVTQVGGGVALLVAVVRGRWDLVFAAVLQVKPFLLASAAWIGVLFVVATLHREALGKAYLDAWLEVSAGRPRERRRSLWLAPGSFGHPVGARDWATGLRNPLTWGRLAVVLVGAGLLGSAGRRVAVLQDPWGASAAATLLWLAAWVEWLATAFGRERDGIALYLLAPIGPAWLLVGKVLGQWPVVALAALAGLAAGFPGGHGAAAALAAGLLAAGSSVVLVSLAAAEVRSILSANPGTGPVHEAALEEVVWDQVPRSLAAWVAVAAAIAYVAVVLWTAGRGWIGWSGAVALAVPAVSFRIGLRALQGWCRNP